ncbi:MAG: enoyl-CoA hydratase-related protein [Actinomycetota bacterium]
MSITTQWGPVSVLTIQRPEKRNCIDAETATRLGAAITDFAADDERHVLIITGAGGNFCSGADLQGTAELGAADRGACGPLGFSALDPGKPTIAAIEGHCVAGGLELAAWCDIRIASTSASFGAFNRRWGVPFIDGGTVRIPRIMGLGNALHLLGTGLRFDSEQMQRMGFVQEVVPDGNALERAREIAGWMSALPQGSLRTDRQSIYQTVGVRIEEGLALEQRIGRASLADPDLAAGLERFAAGQRPVPPAAR